MEKIKANGYWANIRNIGNKTILKTNFRPSQFPLFIKAIDKEFCVNSIKNEESFEFGVINIERSSFGENSIDFLRSIMEKTLLPSDKQEFVHKGSKYVKA